MTLTDPSVPDKCKECQACMPVAMPSRRGALRAGLMAALGSTLGTGVVRAASTIYPTPAETEGPFWADEKLKRSDIRSDTSTGVYQKGYRLGLTIRAYQLKRGTATALSGAWIDMWHANAAGNYSDEPAGQGNANTEGTNWLRGYQITNSAGLVNFTTIFPGWYGGRTPHVHLRVRTFSGKTTTLNFTTQIFFKQSLINKIESASPYNTIASTHTTTNATDSVFNAVSSASGSTSGDPDGDRLAARLTDSGSALSGTFTMYVA